MVLHIIFRCAVCLAIFTTNYFIKLMFGYHMLFHSFSFCTFIAAHTKKNTFWKRSSSLCNFTMFLWSINFILFKGFVFSPVALLFSVFFCYSGIFSFFPCFFKDFPCFYASSFLHPRKVFHQKSWPPCRWRWYRYVRSWSPGSGWPSNPGWLLIGKMPSVFRLLQDFLYLSSS